MIQYISLVCDTMPNCVTGEDEKVEGYIAEDAEGYPCNWGDTLDEILDEVSRDGDFAVICHL